jgi:hypothetical protein
MQQPGSEKIKKPHKICQESGSIICAAALLFFGVMPFYANAVEDGLPLGSALKFSAGSVSAFLVHEGSHALVDKLTNLICTEKRAP